MTRPLSGHRIGRKTNRPAPRRRLSAAVAIRIEYRDETAFGSMVSGRCETTLQRRLAVLHAYRQRYGLDRIVREGEAVLGRVLPRALAPIRCSAARLSERWLFPEPSRVAPAQLVVARGVDRVTARIPLPPRLAAELAAWLGEWQLGAHRPRTPAAAALWEALSAARTLVTTAVPNRRTSSAAVTFVGHATLCVDDGERRVLVDPFLLPRSRRFPGRWQPTDPGELAAPDAVLVTHSHPDHYDPGTLLRLGPDTPVYVPTVARESVLAIDMASRLREIGFRRVHAITPGERVRIGRINAVALPFHGEQPTTGERLHPEVRNEGVTWLLEAAGRRLAILADAGTDSSGDVRDLAERMRDESGAVDGVFCGFRGFALHPVQYAFSSVSRYLPFVPPASWGIRQRLMCDCEHLLDVAERWSASWVVPYAAGGAPWYWLRGLGPRLDGNPPEDVTEPRPEHVLEAAARRADAARNARALPAVDVRVIRVGEVVPL